MKSIILTLIAMAAYANAISIGTLAIYEDESTGPFNQTLVFELAWGGEPTTKSGIVHVVDGRVGFVSKITLVDHGGVAMFIETATQGGAYMWQFGPFNYGPENPLPFVDASGNHPAFRCAWELDVEPVPEEPYAGRFTYRSSPNPHFLPDGGSTALMLLAVLGLLLPWRGKDA